MQNENKRIMWIIRVQIICTFFITFSHSFSSKMSNPIWVEYAVELSQNFALCSFMFISGFLANTTEQLHKYGYLSYLKRRAKRLLIPYFITQLLMLFPKFLLDSSKEKYTIKSIVLGFFFPRESILPHLWFLVALFLLCVLLPVFDRIVKNRILTIVSSIVFTLFVFLPHISNFMCVNDIKQYLIWFFLGIVFSEYKLVSLIKNYILCSALFFSSYVFLATLYLKSGYLIFIIVLNFISILLIISLALSLERVNRLLDLGKYTMTIFILSLPAQNIIEILCIRYGLNLLLQTILMLVTGLIIPIVIGRTVLKLHNKTIRECLKVLIGL